LAFVVTACFGDVWRRKKGATEQEEVVEVVRIQMEKRSSKEGEKE
jgi:hypothetical protein